MFVVIVAVVLFNTLFVVKQQHAVIIERLGRFQKIVGSGLHAKIPIIDRKAATVSLRTMKNGFDIDAKTEDNVTIGLEVSAQYHVSYEMGRGPADSGVYKAITCFSSQWHRCVILLPTLCALLFRSIRSMMFLPKKDDIAKDVNATVSEQMAAYGFTLVSTLITRIALPREVEDSMNQINAAQRTKAAAQDLAEADRIRRVTEAQAEAEAMEKSGEGIANQRKAIAVGIKDSLETIQETGVTNDEANKLFMYTQWTEMMTEFARTGKSSTVVLPASFKETASVFEQMVAAEETNEQANVPPVPPQEN